MSAPNWNWPNSSSNGVPLEWTTLTVAQAIIGTLPNSMSEPHLRTANVGNQPLPSLTKSTWQTTVFTPGQIADNAISAWSADPDNDGHSNLLEYALGGAPLTFEHNLGLTTTIQTEDGHPSSLDLHQNRLPARLATTQIELSTNLTQWDEAGDALQEDRPKLQRVRLPWSAIHRQFARIQVTEH